MTHISWEWDFWGPQLPVHEGWKLHVSIEPHHLDVLRTAVRRVCQATSTPYKVATASSAVKFLNSGSAGWNQVGKIATLYTLSDENANRTLEGLEPELRGLEGPAVDGDLRVSARAPIFARWGSYVSPKGDPLRGGKVTAIDGTFADDDRRRPQHEKLGRIPPFSYVESRSPEQPWAERYLAVTLASATGTSLLYTGVDLVGLRACAIKVRRRRMAYDRCGLDAAARLERECHTLRTIGGRLHGPAVIDFVDEGDWVALVLEHIDGELLATLDLAEERLRNVRGQLTSIVNQAHEVGVLVRDLGPANVMVEASGQVRLIDFEFVGPASNPALNAVSMPFAANRLATSREDDIESLARLFMRSGE